MTDKQKVEALWAAIKRDGDETAAEAFTLLRRRAEQAERERDEARGAMAKMTALYHEAEAVGERAEADNAAVAELLAQLFPKEHRDTWIVWLHEEKCRAARDDGAECSCDGEMYEERIREAIEDHPGATLLERMRALEKVADKAQPVVEAVRGWVDFDACSPEDVVLRVGNERESEPALSAAGAANLVDAFDALEKTS